MPKYRLAVENRVSVRIQGKIPGATQGTHKSVDFTLDMDRISQARVNELSASQEALSESLVKLTHGWDGQRVVIDEATGEPAAYSEEAMQCLLDFPGMAPRIWVQYLNTLALREKN